MSVDLCYGTIHSPYWPKDEHEMTTLPPLDRPREREPDESPWPNPTVAEIERLPTQDAEK